MATQKPTHVLTIVLTRIVTEDNPNGRDYEYTYNRSYYKLGSEAECKATKDGFLIEFNEEFEEAEIICCAVSEIENTFLHQRILNSDSYKISVGRNKKPFYFKDSEEVF